MDVLTSETCWAVNNEIINKWHQVGLSLFILRFIWSSDQKRPHLRPSLKWIDLIKKDTKEIICDVILLACILYRVHYLSLLIHTNKRHKNLNRCSYISNFRRFSNVFRLVRYQVDPQKPVFWVQTKVFFSVHAVYILYAGYHGLCKNAYM